MKYIFSMIVFISLMSMYSLVSAEGPRKEPIGGNSSLTAQQMGDFVIATNPRPALQTGTSIYDLAQYYLDIGKVEGIRGDIAFAQAIKETGFFAFGGDVVPIQNNYSGIGTTGGGVKGGFFRTPVHGVLAQIQHLKAYANDKFLVTRKTDPRFDYVKRGIAPYWEDLNGRWAVPGHSYGQEILTIYRRMAMTPLRLHYNNVKTEAPKLVIRATTPLLNVKAQPIKQVNSGTSFMITGVVGRFFEVNHRYLVHANSSRVAVSLGKLRMKRPVMTTLLDGQTVKQVKKGAEVYVYSENSGKYNVGNGQYIKKSPAVAFVPNIRTQ